MTKLILLMYNVDVISIFPQLFTNFKEHVVLLQDWHQCFYCTI